MYPERHFVQNSGISNHLKTYEHLWKNGKKFSMTQLAFVPEQLNQQPYELNPIVAHQRWTCWGPSGWGAIFLDSIPCRSASGASRHVLAFLCKWIIYKPYLGNQPISSMYGIFTYIFMVNVGKYTIHGWYGQYTQHVEPTITGWWFQFFIFHPIWGRVPF